MKNKATRQTVKARNSPRYKKFRLKLKKKIVVRSSRGGSVVNESD